MSSNTTIEVTHKEEQEEIVPAQVSDANPTTDTSPNGVADLEEYASNVVAVMKPVTITMAIVIWVVRNMTTELQASGSSAIIVFGESDEQSIGERLTGSILNALIFVGVIIVVTVVMVILYKFSCYKVLWGWLIFSTFLLLGALGGYLFYLLLTAFNLELDWLTFCFFLYNFAFVGIVAIFWHAPRYLNQAFLICISALTAIFLTRLPEWTTWCVLGIVAIYDLFAVLLPNGPLKMLVDMAQEREEAIPALIYSASVYIMATKEDVIESDPKVEQVPEKIQNDSNIERIDEEASKGIKLGLGDFIFYSVLVGRASLFDISTVFTCFVAIITGLFITLVLLAIFRRALPALPVSIALGILFYFLTRIFLVPYIKFVGLAQVFV